MKKNSDFIINQLKEIRKLRKYFRIKGSVYLNKSF